MITRRQRLIDQAFYQAPQRIVDEQLHVGDLWEVEADLGSGVKWMSS
jgi:hypothetical protein